MTNGRKDECRKKHEFQNDDGRSRSAFGGVKYNGRRPWETSLQYHETQFGNLFVPVHSRSGRQGGAPAQRVGRGAARRHRRQGRQPRHEGGPAPHDPAPPTWRSRAMSSPSTKASIASASARRGAAAATRSGSSTGPRGRKGRHRRFRAGQGLAESRRRHLETDAAQQVLRQVQPLQRPDPRRLVRTDGTPAPYRRRLSQRPLADRSGQPRQRDETGGQPAEVVCQGGRPTAAIIS